MYLKRIELHGFKSFADRTELEFRPGITAVVGPNGSGKSNISDAVRWVLGEQSAKSLRGAKMEDIIFAGSDSRKGVNYGEVSLTLDNSDGALDLDFMEVTVTRRVYRTGDSEYFINKDSCRLKDITELFMDTGLGKEAYSIIGQGRIEEILSTKSEERRGIFEEAAGIVKYKARKREATKKLEETESNLARVHDIISELREQERPLEQQAVAAKEFRRVKDQLKNKEVGYYVYHIENVHQNWEKTSGILDELNEQRITLSTSLSQQDAIIEKKRHELNQSTQQLDELQKQLLHISEDVEKLEGQKDVLLERERNQGQNRQSYEESLQLLLAKLESKQNEVNKFKSHIDQINSNVKSVENEMTKTMTAFSLTNAELSDENIEKRKADLIEILNEMASSRNDVRHLTHSYENLERRIARLEEENDAFLKQRESLNKKKQEITDHLQRITGKLEVCKEQYRNELSELENIKTERDECGLILRKEENQIETLKSRLEILNDMQNDYAGFFQGVKEILKLKDSHSMLKGVLGAVAELIQVPAKIETAIETALGGALQHIVVETEEVGRSCIQFLKQNRYGRATFLPLNVIEGRKPGTRELDSCKPLKGFVGLASDLVKSEGRYQSIVQYLLGNVFVAENIGDANAIARAVSYRYRVVTLEGDVVNPGGSMTGGTVQKRTSSLLGRNREIELLEQQMETSLLRVEELKHRWTEFQHHMQLKEQSIEKLRIEGENLRLNEQRILGEEKEWTISWHNIQERLQLFDLDKVSYVEEMNHVKESIAKSEAQLHILSEQQTELQLSIERLEVRRKSSNEEKEVTDKQIMELKIKVATYKQEEESITLQYESLLQDYKQLSEEKLQLVDRLNQLEQHRSTNQQETTEITSSLQMRRTKKDQLVSKVSVLKGGRTEDVQLIEHLETETKALRKQVKEVEDSFHHAEVKKNRLDVELDNLLQKLQEEYEMHFELAKERFPIPEDPETTKSEIKELKGQILALGEVNLGAIDEFDRLCERLNHLSTQFDDLFEAKKMLYEVITEIEQEMSKRFIETFEAIQYHFGHVFVKLFGGGRADLQLSEPDNLLTTGVDIVAQPPGKKLQNLALLSGGERALTAIALLFAILHVKTVPFCVLDEVEAALDEANVSRFAQYLREFSQDTQFIVVTHRKGTMEEADVLYGVTMQESGVSKLVSVKLEDQRVATA